MSVRVLRVLTVGFLMFLGFSAVSSVLLEVGLTDPFFPVFSKETACAQDAAGRWRTEFESVCSRTADAETLTSDDLQRLIDKCDLLKSSIEALDESAKKVYLKRLQSCRDLLFYLLETRQGK